MKKILRLAIGVCVFGFQHTAQGAGLWMAKAEWYFAALDTRKVYQGRGGDQQQALRDARNRCILRQAGPWSAYCGAAPTRVDYTELEDCGTPWSDWKQLDRGVGNPCPSDCFRGARLMRETRLRGFPVRPQHREMVRCWRKK